MPAPSPTEIERAIEFPDDGQVELFLDFEWLVPQIGGQWCSDLRNPLFPVHWCFTAPERMEPLRIENERGRQFEAEPWPLMTPDGWHTARPMSHQAAFERCELVPMRGRELFTRLAATSDYHELQINSGCGTYDEPRRQGCLRLVCGNTRLLAQGLDPRPGTRVLPARSIAEIRHYMRMFHSATELKHQLEYVGDELAAIYEGVDLQGRAHRQAFRLVTPQADPLAFGPGASGILCGGLMAHLLDFHRATLRENFHPAMREGLHQMTPGLLREIGELLKMLDPQTDRLAPEHIRFQHTPGFVKHKPHVLTGAWLRETRGELERFLAGGPAFRL